MNTALITALYTSRQLVVHICVVYLTLSVTRGLKPDCFTTEEKLSENDNLEVNCTDGVGKALWYHAPSDNITATTPLDEWFSDVKHDDITNHFKNNNRTLYIKHVKAEDSGYFICKIQNASRTVCNRILSLDVGVCETPKVIVGDSTSNCDCFNNGTFASVSCHADIECDITPKSQVQMYWVAFKENGKLNNITSDKRYVTDWKELKRQVKAILTIHGVTEKDYKRSFKVQVLSKYTTKRLGLIQLCNATRVPSPIVQEGGFVVMSWLIPLCVLGLILIAAVLVYPNMPFIKVLFAKCRGKFLYKRKYEDILKYDTTLMYDTDNKEASYIAEYLKKDELHNYEVSSIDDGSEGHLEIEGRLQPLLTSATVIFIVTPDSNKNRMLEVATNESACHNTPKEQILIHTGKAPEEFKHITTALKWYRDMNIISRDTGITAEYVNAPGTESSEHIQESYRENGSEEITGMMSVRRPMPKNTVSRLYNSWKTRKFYNSLVYALSIGFNVVRSNASEQDSNQCVSNTEQTRV